MTAKRLHLSTMRTSVYVVLIFMLAPTRIFSIDTPSSNFTVPPPPPPPPPPPGANSLCANHAGTSSPRIRRDWDFMTTQERNLYIEAVELSIEQGLYKAFIPYHIHSATYAHEITCTFALWHRRFLLGFENMLRSLGNDGKFKCLTVPYWNIMEHYKDQERYLCSSYASCSRIVGSLGGIPVRRGETRQFSGIEAVGSLHMKRPVQGLKDDHNRSGLIRGEGMAEVMIPPEASYAAVWNILEADDFVLMTRSLQQGIHDYVHDTLEGFMPTYASPIDPLFGPWHSLVDLLLLLWEQCHSTRSTDQKLFSTCAKATPRAQTMFPDEIGGANIIYMRSSVDGMDISEDPKIGKFFSNTATFDSVSSIRLLGENEFTYQHMQDPMWEYLNACDSDLTDFPTAAPPPTLPPVAAGGLTSDLRSALRERYDDDAIVGSYMSYYVCILSEANSVITEQGNDFISNFLDGKVSVAVCNFLKPAVTPEAPSTLTAAPAPAANPLPPQNVEVDWFIPPTSGDALPLMTARVGDRATFLWDESSFHNVYVHPTKTCDAAGAILVGTESGASYTFTQVGQVIFACDVSSHCEDGQIVAFAVVEAEDSVQPADGPAPMDSAQQAGTTSGFSSSFGILKWDLVAIVTTFIVGSRLLVNY